MFGSSWHVSECECTYFVPVSQLTCFHIITFAVSILLPVVQNTRVPVPTYSIKFAARQCSSKVIAMTVFPSVHLCSIQGPK